MGVLLTRRGGDRRLLSRSGEERTGLHVSLCWDRCQDESCTAKWISWSWECAVGSRWGRKVRPSRRHFADEGLDKTLFTCISNALFAVLFALLTSTNPRSSRPHVASRVPRSIPSVISRLWSVKVCGQPPLTVIWLRLCSPWHVAGPPRSQDPKSLDPLLRVS